MHVFGFPLDLNWFLQFIVTAFLIALGLLHLVKNTASKYFMVDANFEPPSAHRSPAVADAGGDCCVVCGNSTKKQCSGCKAVKYCSEACQRSHWSSGHKTKCKDLKLSGKANLVQSASLQCGQRFSSAVALVPACRTTHIIKQSKEVLFPYEEFVELFNRDKPGFPPCGLLNCGNSCFANVVLQCLMYTRPLVAYLLEKGHRGECRRNDWCFLCEFQTHVVRASESRQPFSPINILSRLPNIGGNLGYGKQEDAHEFMRFAIDTMQSVCLDEYGGEKAVDARTQETTLIQHIFGGHLQSQVICTKCNNISNQYENMMDLTVEIHGDAASLEECLNQFTVRERLHGDNMYKCDGCNDYVMAWKRLTVRKAPNILTIALKRFQSGRFGKLNKRVTFPETLDLNPYMSEEGDGDNVYKLYAVIVHVDMLNASYFGHYICYTKDFYGNWYRIDDCKVTRVDLEEVLLQGAYMLMYSRVCARPSCLKAVESLGKDQQTVKIVQGGGRYAKELVECSTMAGPIDSICMSGSLAPDSNSHSRVCSSEKKSPSFTNSEYVEEDMEILGPESSSAVSEDVEVHGNGYLNATEETASPVVDVDRLVSGDGSSLSERFEPEAYSLNYKLASSNYGVGRKNRAVNGAKETTSSSSRSSLPKENGVCLGVETSHDGSVSGLSLDGDLNEDNPVDSKDHQEKMENNKGLPSASSIKDAEGKLAGRNSSGTKPKPLFPPGFLGRRSSNKSMKRGVRTMSEVGDFVSCNHKKGDSGFQEPGCHHQNGARTQEVGNPHLEGNTSLPFTSGEEVGNCLDKDMVAHSKSGEFTNLCSGESATVINDNKEINNIDRDGQPLIEKTPRAIVRSSMSETTRSDLVGTDVEML